MTWSRCLIVAGICFGGALGSYLMVRMHLVRPGDGLFLALLLAVLGLWLAVYSVYRLIRFGRFDSGYDASIDGPLSEKLEDDEGRRRQQGRDPTP